MVVRPASSLLCPLRGADQIRLGSYSRFDDDKVAIVPREKIASLDGGGEDSVAYLLLYKSTPF